MKQKIVDKLFFIKIGAAVLVILVAVFGVLEYSERIYSYAVHTEIQIDEVRESVRKMDFCIQRDIKRCTDESIESWNDTHPGDKFTPRPFERIAESAVETVNAKGIHRFLFFTPKLRAN